MRLIPAASYLGLRLIRWLCCLFHGEEKEPVYCNVCGKTATANVIYGLYSEYEKGRPHHVLDVCSEHLQELGKRCKPAVAVGLMHFVLCPAGKGEKESEVK